MQNHFQTTAFIRLLLTHMVNRQRSFYTQLVFRTGGHRAANLSIFSNTPIRPNKPLAVEESYVIGFGSISGSNKV